MKDILITGGTGNLGKALSSVLKEKGFPFVVASRSNNENSPQRVVMDLLENKGVVEAVKDRDIIFHLATDLKKDTVLMQNLLNGIGENKNIHLIYISIVGIDQTPFNYYQQKLGSEVLIKQSGIPYTILRATQFHGFIDQVFSTLLKFKIGILPKKVLVQAIDNQTVAEKLYQLSLLPAENKTAEIGGLQSSTLEEMAKQWMQVSGKRIFVLNLPLFGKLKKAFCGGALLTPNVELSGQSWQDFLNQKHQIE